LFGALIYIKTKQRDRFFIFEPLPVCKCNRFPFVDLLCGGFVVLSETAFKPLPLGGFKCLEF